MKTLTLSLAALLAAFLTFAFDVRFAEAGYKGKCDHWLKAAFAAERRGQDKQYQLAMQHYHACTRQLNAGDIIIDIGTTGVGGHKGKKHH